MQGEIMKCFDCGGEACTRASAYDSEDYFYLCKDCYKKRFEKEDWVLFPELQEKEESEKKEGIDLNTIGLLLILLSAIIYVLGNFILKWV
jgi:hypothetical protein